MTSLAGLRPLLLASVLICPCFALSCGGDDDSNNGGAGATGGSAGTGDAGETGSSGGSVGAAGESSGTGGSAGRGGSGGSGGTGIVSQADPRQGFGMVVDGVVSKSENFTAILTLGERPGGNTSMGSSMYRLNMGLVGSTQP